MSGRHPRRRKRRKGRKSVTQTTAANPSPPAPLNFSALPISTIRDRFHLLKQRTPNG